MPYSEEERKARFKEWYVSNIDREREKRRQYSRKFRKNFPELRLWQAAKQRAQERNLLFDISVEDITIPELCPILKKPLLVNTRYPPSLDRIDSSKGYVKGNVWVISLKANVMKNDATIEELKEFSNWIKSL